MLVIFILGFFIDFFEICSIHVPILTPVLVTHFGFDPVWLGCDRDEPPDLVLDAALRLRPLLPP